VVIGADDGARQSVIVSPCLVRVRFWQRLRPRALLQQKVIKEHNPHIAGDMGSIQLRLQEAARKFTQARLSEPRGQRQHF
jgi:hypothetical protein